MHEPPFGNKKPETMCSSPGEPGLQYYLLATDLCFHTVNLQQIQRKMYYKCPAKLEGIFKPFYSSQVGT